MTINEFIEQVIIGEIDKIIKKGYHYLGFILVANAIEFCGALLDTEPLDTERISNKRFKKALSFFPPEYRNDKIKNALYKLL
ncbi:MAG: hypothetical protein PVG03_19075, partial [Desulfarculaceae bacterium]